MNSLEIFGTVILLAFTNLSKASINKIYLHHFWLPFNQSLIDNSIRTYTEYRYLYNQPKPLDLVIFFSNEIVKTMNATLLYSKRNKIINKDNSLGQLNHPSLLAMTKVHFLYNKKSNRTFWEMYHEIQPNSSKSFHPKIHQIDSLEDNFVYCAVPKRKKDSFLRNFLPSCLFLLSLLTSLVRWLYFFLSF